MTYQEVCDFFLAIWHEKINFLELHYLYIALLSFVVSGFYYAEPNSNWSYIDALFMSVTSTTNTGLNTIAMSQFSVYRLLVMFFSSILGSHVTVSYVIVLVRKHYFSKRFDKVLEFNKIKRQREINRRKFNKHAAAMQLNAHDGIPLSRVSVSTLPVPPSQRRFSFRSMYSLPNIQPSLLGRFHMHSKLPWQKHPPKRDAEYNARELEKSNQEYWDDGEQAEPKSPDSGNTEQTMTGADLHTSAKGSSAEEIPIQALDTHGGIAFADNVGQQRRIARKQLEQDRQYDDLMAKIANHDDDPHHPDVTADDSYADIEQEAEEIKSIMQQPIHKHQLSRKQRYHIGGTEYRVLDFLAKGLPVFYFGLIILFAFGFRIYFAVSAYARQVLQTSNGAPLDPWLFSFFTSVSSLNNLGISPLDASMVPFSNAPAPLLMSGFLIIAGNTGYAILLRLTIWILYKLTPRSRIMDREMLLYLLNHPRRCYTNLFPSTQTWWLLGVLIIITLIELIVFLATNYWLPVLSGMSWGTRILDGLFQAISTRNAGFAVVSIMYLNPGTHIIYIIAMYISVYPVAISIHNSNIYKERALGIYGTENDDGLTGGDGSTGILFKLRRLPTISSVVSSSRKLIPKRPSFYVMAQIQNQLTSEITWLLAGIFAINVIEARAIMSPAPITSLTVIYECVSAFANAGASVGYPNQSTSQSGQYHTLSKIVIIILMYRGRHRGLPSAIDHAVLLPSEQLDKKEEQEHQFKQRYAEAVQAMHGNPRWLNRSVQSLV